jgi:hypothetical protein
MDPEFNWNENKTMNKRTTQAYAKHPALLRKLELDALALLAKNGNTRIYIGR